MNKKWCAVLAAMVLAVAAYADDFPAYLDIVRIREDVFLIGAKSPHLVPANLVIPKGVTIIGQEAFEGNTRITSVTIPSSAWTIYGRAFEGCTSLASVVIENGMKEIWYGAFNGCTSLTSVTIPRSVAEISFGVFRECDKLKEVYYTGTRAQWNNIKGLCDNGELLRAMIVCSDGEQRPQARNGVVTSGSFVCGYTSNLPANLVIPQGITAIGESSFAFGKSLVSVVIPNGVTYIGGMAFGGCESLMSVTIPRTVTEIGTYAFVKCHSNLEIQYSGTKTQWNVIKKGSNAIDIFTIVHCTDGDIIVN